MDLADTERLLAIPDRVLVTFREALRAAGFDERFLATLARVGERLDDPLRGPMRAWHARRSSAPAAAMARLLVLHDPLGRDEAARALGDLTPLIDGGLIEETDAGLISRTHAALAGNLYVFGDRATGGIATPPLNGVTPTLARAAVPHGPVDNALDLGCGAGAVALTLAKVAGRVVAADINQRALALTRYNARFNGVENVEVRHGDLFDAVGAERFDRIASQPPFIARPGGIESSAYVHGGDRGDEISLRAIAGVASHLSPRGRAVVVADWPLAPGDPVDGRVRAAIGGAPVDVLVLQSPKKNLDEYCTLLAASEHPRLDGAFARATCMQRDHLERVGLEGISLAIVVLEPSRGRPQTSLLAVRHAHDAPVTAEAIDRILAGRSMATGDARALLDARLRLSAGARLVEQPSAHGAPAAVIAQLPPNQPEWPIVLEATAAAVLRRIDEATTAREAARAFAREERIPLDDATALVERVAREGLLRGALTTR